MKLFVPIGLKMDVVDEESIYMEAVKENIFSSYYLYMIREIIVSPELFQKNKFAVINDKKDSKELSVIFFSEDIFHVDEVRHLKEDGFDFVGAGIWKFVRKEEKEKIDISSFEVEFKSASCIEGYGFDRPKEKKLQEEIIKNIKEILEKLFVVIDEKVKAEKAELGIG